MLTWHYLRFLFHFLLFHAVRFFQPLLRRFGFFQGNDRALPNARWLIGCGCVRRQQSWNEAIFKIDVTAVECGARVRRKQRSCKYESSDTGGRG